MKYLLSSVLALLATAALADVIWRTEWHPDSSAYGVNDVAPAIDGGAFVAFNYSTGGKGGGYSGSIAKFSSSGVLQWHRSGIASLGGSRDGRMVLEPDALGNLYVSALAVDGFTAKYSAGGTLQWSLPFASHSRVMDMALDPNGNSYVLRENWTAQQGFYSDMIKVNPEGGPVWTRSITTTEPGSGCLEWDWEGDLACFTSTNGVTQVIVFDHLGNEVRNFNVNLYVENDAEVAFGPENELYLRFRRVNADGTIAWYQGVTGGSGGNAVECDGNKVYITGYPFDETRAYYLNRGNGAVIWSGPIPPPRMYRTRHPEPSLDGLGNFWLVHGLWDGDQHAVPARLKASGLLSVVYPTSGDAWLAVGAASDLYFLEKPGTFGGPGYLVISKLHNGIDHDSAQLVRGRTTEHSRYAMMHSGNGYWSIAPGPVLTNQQSPISIIVKHTAPPENPTEMGVILESRGSANGVKQSVAIYNFSTSSWTSLESNVVLPSGVNPDRYAILPIASPVNYIGPGREIRSRVEYRNDSPVLVWPWTARINREMIRYVK